MPRKREKKTVQASLFEPASGVDEAADDGLPASKTRLCGRCGKDFWSAVQSGRPSFVPLFCRVCDKFLALALRMRGWSITQCGCRTHPTERRAA